MVSSLRSGTWPSSFRVHGGIFLAALLTALVITGLDAVLLSRLAFFASVTERDALRRPPSTGEQIGEPDPSVDSAPRRAFDLEFASKTSPFYRMPFHVCGLSAVGFRNMDVTERSMPITLLTTRECPR